MITVTDIFAGAGGSEACVLSLFAGYGGLDLALEEVLDVRPLYVSDFEAGPSKVLAFRYPDAPNLGDITKVTWASLPCHLIRIVCGGSPCQDISAAGKQAGMQEGTRSNLWVEMREAIRVIRPELVVWENVNAAKSATASSDLESCPGCVGDLDDAEPVLRALGRVLGDLAELGFDAEWVSLPAAAVGCAHLRWRVFVVAWPADAPSDPRWVGHRNARTPADAARLGHEWTWGARGGRDGSQDGDSDALVTLLPSPAVNDMGAGKDIEKWDAWTEKMRAAHANGNGHGKSLDIEVRRLPTPTTRDVKGRNQRNDATCLTGALLPTPTVQDARSSGSSQDATDTHHEGTTLTDATVRQPSHWGIYAASIARAEAVFGPAPEPKEQPGHCPIGTHGKSERLSCTFDEWHMGLPAGWITGVPRVTHAEALKMCGNGVVPAQAALAIRICLDRVTEAVA